MSKFYVNVTTRLIIEQDDGVETGDVIQEMDYNFVANSAGATITDTKITDWEVFEVK